MRIATWNVNSVKARIGPVLDWFKAEAPDVACLQEIKTTDDAFPRMEFESLGYNVETNGQKTYNGVALLSKFPLSDVMRGLPGDDSDDHARYIEALVEADTPVRVGCLYLPNGNPAPGPKYDYKLSWMDRLRAHAGELLALEERLVLSGDYNVIPGADDVYNPENWLDDALFRPETRAKFQALKNLGLTEAFEQVDRRPHQYTFWDYQAGAWQRNNGLRIDHHLLSAEAADALKSVIIHKDVRGGEKPSDHVPVVVELED